MPANVIIMGAAGRDFHDFLTYFKRNRGFRVVAFTAAQIPGIARRDFPAELAGAAYPDGIPIHREERLTELIAELEAEWVCLAYSDLAHMEVMEKASLAMSAGANFMLLAPEQTQVRSRKPVIAVTAVRTGCGKSQTARAIGEILRRRDKRPIAIRHSMPYGKDLRVQTCQRFAEVKDFRRHRTTIEEEEEYQPWLDHGIVIYAGFDYREIVRQAEREGDVLIFDGGNNDSSMIRPDLQVTVVDPHRAGHEAAYYPGLVNLLQADVVVINKVDSAPPSAVRKVAAEVAARNPGAQVIRARSELRVDHPELLKRARCAVIGDGPTLTHGGMSFGAGTLAVKAHGGRMVDPRPALAGSIAETYRKYPHLGREIPAMGYGRAQIRDLEATIAAIDCDVVVDGTPANLPRILKITQPVVQVGYDLDPRAIKKLEAILVERGL